MNEMRQPSIAFKVRRFHPDARLPMRWSAGAVGYDLHAHLLTEHGRPNKRVIPPNSTVNIPTGLGIECPSGYFAFVCPRSGLGKYSISVTNSPGLIDTDYRGEIQVLVYNGSYVNYWVQHDDRIAQLVIMPVTPTHFTEVKELTNTERGVAGFGSTGT
jgi:dUTP pyrophosphatase